MSSFLIFYSYRSRFNCFLQYWYICHQSLKFYECTIGRMCALNFSTKPTMTHVMCHIFSCSYSIKNRIPIVFQVICVWLFLLANIKNYLNGQFHLCFSKPSLFYFYNNLLDFKCLFQSEYICCCCHYSSNFLRSIYWVLFSFWTNAVCVLYFNISYK